MIAAWRSWFPELRPPVEALARSLGLFAGVDAASFAQGPSAYAFLDGPRPGKPRPGWQPARCQLGAVLFHGSFDNRRELAEALGLRTDDPALIYGETVARWGDAADSRMHGDYCAIIDLGEAGLRLSRSPWDAPPLHYAWSADRAVAASVMRTLIAAGVARELDRRVFAESLHGLTERDERSWYKGTFDVPPGAIVRLDRTGTATTRWYDPAAIPEVRFKRDTDYVEAANEQLSRAVGAALAATRKPGIALSGGLDSSIVADETLRQLPPGATLPSFTFVPHPDWDGTVPLGGYGSERAWVEAFARDHPALRPRFIANASGFEAQGREFAEATGMPFRMIQVATPYEGVWRAAREEGCDTLLLADHGNTGFSNEGKWASVEFFLTLQWRQLYLALKHARGDTRPMWRRFAARSLLPLLPGPIRRRVRRFVHAGEETMFDLQWVVRPEVLERFGVDVAAADSAREAYYDQVYSRKAANSFYYRDLALDSGVFAQAYEQVYGVKRRDVTAYRPFLELCLGMPTGQFVRDGLDRWLARRMAKGRMPETQRLNRLYGYQQADWNARLAPHREQMRAEVERLAQHPWLGDWFDTGQMLGWLDAWPEPGESDPAVEYRLRQALPVALNAAKFANWFDGRNE